MLKLLLSTAVAFTMLPAAAFAGSLKAERELCIRSPELAFCIAQVETRRSSVTSEQVKRVDARVRANFRYRPDPDGQDTWDNRTPDVRAGRRWEGDCDELVVATINELIDSGVPRDRVYRLAVKINSSDGNAARRSQDRAQEQLRANHLVGAVRLDDGRVVVVGDTTSRSGPRSISEYENQVVLYSRVDQGPQYTRTRPQQSTSTMFNDDQ